MPSEPADSLQYNIGFQFLFRIFFILLDFRHIRKHGDEWKPIFQFLFRIFFILRKVARVKMSKSQVSAVPFQFLFRIFFILRTEAYLLGSSANFYNFQFLFRIFFILRPVVWRCLNHRNFEVPFNSFLGFSLFYLLPLDVRVSWTLVVSSFQFLFRIFFILHIKGISPIYAGIILLSIPF